MRRILVVLTLATALGGVGMLALAACGGGDKPPLTPDTIEGDMEAGAPATSSSAAPAAPATPGAK